MEKKIVAATVVGLLALTGCGGVQPDAHYSDAEELRDSLDAEGFRCSGGEPSSIAEGYGESLECDEGLSVAVWEEDLPDYVDDPGTSISMGSVLGGRHTLTSDTWIIVSSNEGLIAEIAEMFGGTYRGSSEELQREFD